MNQYPITLARAKKVAKQRLGRLPRPGYSVVVGGVFTGSPPFRTWDYQLSVENYAASFACHAGNVHLLRRIYPSSKLLRANGTQDHDYKMRQHSESRDGLRVNICAILHDNFGREK